MPELRAKKKVSSFEDLHIFQEARELAGFVFVVTSGVPFRCDFSLVDQMRRSALSIVSNIAEGFERETPAEFIRFLFVARGSCGELRAQALICWDLKKLTEEQHRHIEARCKIIGVGISNLIRYLKQHKAQQTQRTQQT